MKILVVNVNWLGDVVFSLPVFKALKRAYPDSEISCLAVGRVREALEHSPLVDRIILFDEHGRHKSILGKLRLALQLREEKFDAAFLIHRSFFRALLVFLAGIPRRAGYRNKGREIFLTEAFTPPDEDSVHRSDYYSGVAEMAGIPVVDRICDLVVKEPAAAEIKALLEREGIGPDEFLTVLNPGGNWDLKRWPQENWVQLLQKIRNETGSKMVITGAAKDQDLAAQIIRRAGDGAVNLAGKTNLTQLIALMQRADIVISADSGPSHLASGVGTEMIVLFGPTRPELTGPRGKKEPVILQKDVGCNRAPCFHLACPDNICMKAVGVQEVFETFYPVYHRREQKN